ncbi:Glycosyl hydrolases family 16 [Gammaproteobacteria bacterium MOLA455]|nr:Glycosyl hydrolases family 16 [Gammaproteobacteria bacterium MOLA455]
MPANTLVGTAHWNDGGIFQADGVTTQSYSSASYGDTYPLSGGETLANAFHVFGLTWTPDRITWYIDNVRVFQQN